MSSDFKLWFNVLPTIYDKMTLTVETTNNTLTISRTAEGMYEAGKLYKVVKKEIPAEKWVKKGGETPTESSYTIEFNNTSKTVPSITETTKASTLVIAGVEYLEAQPFSGPINAYYGGDENNGSPLRIGKSKENGSITMALSKDGQINANMIIISAKQYSTGKTFAIGVNGSAKQKPGEDYTDLEFALDGSPLTSIKLDSDGYIYVKSITVVKGIDKRHNINVTEVEGGTLSASAIKAEEGAEITLTAEPQLGYEFNGDWSVVAADGTVINIVDNKFTMPAQDVTVSGTFSESTSTPTFASLAELVATGAPSTTARKVTVTLTDEEIIRFHTLKDGTVAGAIIKVGRQEVKIFCTGTPSDWKVGGTISGTLTNCDWMLYVNKSTQKETWELCPADYSELTYKAPLPICATPVITVAEDGAVSIDCETVGATIHYTVGDSPDDPTETDKVFSAATLTDGQTIKAIAFAEGYKPSAVASKKYTVGGATSYFVKVTTTPTDWSGTYLIVYETGNVAFDGSLADLDVAENTVAVTISENKIEATDALMKSVFVIDGKAGSLKSASGYYVGYTGKKNGMNTNQTTVYKNVFEFDAKTKVITIKSSNSYLKYNSTSDQTRFRYYKSGQKDIQLYKLAN